MCSTCPPAHLAVSLAEGLSCLRLKLELVLIARAKAVHGAHLVGAQGLAEQVDGRHLDSLVLVRLYISMNSI